LVDLPANDGVMFNSLDWQIDRWPELAVTYWQEAATAILILTAAGFLLWQATRGWTTGGHGCGGCRGCAGKGSAAPIVPLVRNKTS
jgi:hypothetical protein